MNCNNRRFKILQLFENEKLTEIVIFQQWYTAQIEMLCTWLSERLDHSLHLYQCTCLAHIVKKIYSDFELQAIAENKLNSKTYQTISQRMQTEEATCALTMSAQNEESVERKLSCFIRFLCF